MLALPADGRDASNAPKCAIGVPGAASADSPVLCSNSSRFQAAVTRFARVAHLLILPRRDETARHG
jgi:hypothetical protein